MHRIARAFALLVLPLVVAPAALVQQGGGSAVRESSTEELVRRAADELADVGYPVDLDALTVESLTRREARRRELRHDARAVDSGRDAAFVELLHGFGDWRYDDADDLGRWTVRAMERLRAGFWVPEERTLVVVEPRRASDADPSRVDDVVHALVHARQDARAGAPDAAPRTTEEANVRQCLREGEALLVQTALDLVRGGETLDELEHDTFERRLDGQSITTRLALLDRVGAAFACVVYRFGGFAAVRDLRADAPPSTEQILHPEKHGRDTPRAVTLPPWPDELPSAELLVEDVLGELRIYELLRLLEVEDPTARIAAAGWDGDRIALYRTTERGEVAVVWRSVWDRERDADRFYRALAHLGDGEWRIDGATVDWVRTVDGALAAHVLDRLADHAAPAARPEDEGDAETTAAVERRLRRAVALPPFVVDGRWVVPDAGFSVPMLNGWEASDDDDASVVWTSPLSGGATASVDSMPLPGGTTLEEFRRRAERTGAFGALVPGEMHSLEEVVLDGRRVLRREGEAFGDADSRVSALALVESNRLHVLAVRYPAAREAEYGPDVEAIFGGLRFDAEDHAPEPPPEDDEEEAPPPVRDELEIRVVDTLDGEPEPYAEVFVAAEWEGDYGLGRRERIELVEERGRRFVADASGSVRVACRGDLAWLVARSEGLLALDRTFFHGSTCTLRLSPTRSVAVRVVNSSGIPVPDVPVMVAPHPGAEPRDRLDAVTDRFGEARWELPYAELATSTEDLSGCVASFDFPVADQPLVPCGPELRLDEPIVLRMPPTGSLVLDLGEEGNESEDLPTVVYADGATLSDADDESSFAFEAPGEMAFGRWRTGDTEVRFPHVGLGLRLHATAAERFEGVVVDGPTEAGEEVRALLDAEAYLHADREFRQRLRMPGDGLHGVCLDHEGDPVANQELEWGRNNATIEGATRFQASGSTDTDGEGRFRIPVFDGPLHVEGPSFDPDDPPPVAEEVVTLRALLDDGRVLQWTEEYLHDPESGAHELGELYPDETVHAIRVRVADDRGRPLEGTECLLRVGSGGDFTASTADVRRGAVEEEHVWFGVRADRASCFVRAQAPGFERTEWIEVLSDTTFQELQLQPADPRCSVRGELLLPDDWRHLGGQGPGMPPGFFVDRLDGDDPTRIQQELRRRADGVAFSLAGLEPGEYRLCFDPDRSSPQAGLVFSEHAAHFAEDFVPLTTFRLEGDEHVLDPIDLRERVQRVRVTVVDEEGEPFEGRVVLRGSNDTGQTWESTFPEGIGEFGEVLHSIDGGVDLRVIAEGHREVVLEDARGETVVRLVEGGLVVRVRLARAVELPREGDRLVASLSSREPDRAYRTAPRTEFSDRVATWMLPRSGEWRLRWYLVREVDGEELRRRVSVPWERCLFEVRDDDELQTIEVEPPSAERLERAGERFR